MTRLAAPAAVSLDHDPWNGHAVVVGKREADWQAVGEVLEQFAPSQREAVARYREFLLRSLTEVGQSVTRLGDLCRMNPASVSRAVEVARAEARHPEGRREEEKA